MQLQRARDEVAEAREWGFGPEDLRLLDAQEASERLAATSVLGGTYTPHCAVIHPARLVRGLARAVEASGVPIYEQTPVTDIAPGVVRTTRGDVRAEVVVRATEGYTPTLPRHRRDLAPVYSLMLATEPLSEDFWARTGLAERETWHDLRHLVIYGQRTADGRLAFGGRGAPYHFGSRIRPQSDREPRASSTLRRILDELFPHLDGGVTHTWGGPLGIARDWCASVGLDRATGLAWAGGYVGDGVTTTNLAGRTLADLITGGGDRPDPAALGRPPVTALGARAVALARCHRLAAADVGGRRRGAAHRPPVATRSGHVAADSVTDGADGPVPTGGIA